MKSNYVIFLVLSFAILTVWNLLVLKPQRKGLPPPPAVSAAGPARPGVTAAVPAAPAPDLPRLERIMDFEFGPNRVEFNLYGAGVRQWRVTENGKAGGTPLVLRHLIREDPLTTFPDVAFQPVPPSPGEAAFEGERPDGLWIRKTYKLSSDGYLHGLSLLLENRGKAPVDASFALGWGPGLESGDRDPKEAAASQRAIAFQPPKFTRLKPGLHEGGFHWWAVDARYFLAAFIPEKPGPVSLETVKEDKFFSVRRKTSVVLAPGQKQEESLRLYLGPKGYDALAGLGLGLEKAVDFGAFAPLGRVIRRFLSFFHRATRNYGWAVILLTMVIQALVLPLTVKSFRHGQKMKTLQPQMKRIQDMYKSDPKRLNAEMMQMYQRHGLKFMGMEGCFPVLIQMPVFFALYTTLHNSYELRHAPWIGWIKDLAAPDPFYVLPVLMGAGMLVQQKMSSASLDPAQAKIMYLMPVVFTFIFLKMPAGLVIYWLTNSLLTIAIQGWLLKKHSVKEATA